MDQTNRIQDKLRFKKQLTTAQVLERYLAAVEFWLPRKQRRDLLAEISEDLHSQIEEREAALSRPLDHAELEALLKQRGRPLVVANGYRPLESQSSLIGPLWFPIYKAVLKVALFGYVPLWVAVSLIVKRVQNPYVDWFATLASAWSMALTVAFFAACVVTFVFAFVQFVESRTHFMGEWEISDLPPINDPRTIKRANSIAETLVGVVFVMWWLGEMHTQVILDGPALKITLTSVWMPFFWAYLGLGLFNIGLAVANLRRPYWNNLRASCRLVSDLAGGALFCWLLKANVLGTIFVAKLDAVGMLALRHAIYLVMDRSFPLAVIVVGIAVSVDVWRLVRVNGRDRFNLNAQSIAH